MEDKPLTITELRKILRWLAARRALSGFYRRHRLAPRTMARVQKRGWSASKSTLTSVERAIRRDQDKGLIPKEVEAAA